MAQPIMAEEVPVEVWAYDLQKVRKADLRPTLGLLLIERIMLSRAKRIAHEIRSEEVTR